MPDHESSYSTTNIIPIKDDGNLYHYTSEHGILGIFRDNKIRLQLSKADSVNDITEGLDIYEHVQAVTERLYLENCITLEQKNILLSFSGKDSYEKEMFYDYQEKVKVGNLESEPYIMCFCKYYDSLPMWNYYSKENKGSYCLHFNKDTLHNYISKIPVNTPTSTDLVDVIYESKVKENIIKHTIMSNKDNEENKFTENLKTYINTYKYIFKNECFKHECETRLIYNNPKDTQKSYPNKTYPIQFKPKNGYIVPYIQIESSDALINGITCGSLANKELSKRNLKMYLESQGHDLIELLISNIPIRI